MSNIHMDASHQHHHRHYPRQQPDHQHQPQLQYKNNNVKTLSTKPKSQHLEIRLISVLLRKIKKDLKQASEVSAMNWLALTSKLTASIIVNTESIYHVANSRTLLYQP